MNIFYIHKFKPNIKLYQLYILNSLLILYSNEMHVQAKKKFILRFNHDFFLVFLAFNFSLYSITSSFSFTIFR